MIFLTIKNKKMSQSNISYILRPKKLLENLVKCHWITLKLMLMVQWIFLMLW